MGFVLVGLGLWVGQRQAKVQAQIADPCVILHLHPNNPRDSVGNLMPIVVGGKGLTAAGCVGGNDEVYPSYYSSRTQARQDLSTPNYPCKNVTVGQECITRNKLGTTVCGGGPQSYYMGCLAYKAGEYSYYNHLGQAIPVSPDPSVTATPTTTPTLTKTPTPTSVLPTATPTRTPPPTGSPLTPPPPRAPRPPRPPGGPPPARRNCSYPGFTSNLFVPSGNPTVKLGDATQLNGFYQTESYNQPTYQMLNSAPNGFTVELIGREVHSGLPQLPDRTDGNSVQDKIKRFAWLSSKTNPAGVNISQNDGLYQYSYQTNWRPKAIGTYQLRSYGRVHSGERETHCASAPLTMVVTADMQDFVQYFSQQNMAVDRTKADFNGDNDVNLLDYVYYWQVATLPTTR